MKTSEVEILIVPGWSGSDDDHWQTRWERSLRTARRVQQKDWHNPHRDHWVGNLISTIAKAEGDLPLVLVAHSLGVATVVHAAAELPVGTIAGAFLVAPADVENAQNWPLIQGMSYKPGECGFAPLPRSRLPFFTALVASTNDPFCSIERAHMFADAWGAALIPAGDVGHINVASGHGPWPEGLMRFGWFLKQVGDEVRARQRPN